MNNNITIADETRLFDARGRRKYVDTREARRFLAVAADEEPTVRLFCELLHYSGCRISEALAVAPEHVDSSGGLVVFRSLKRRRVVYRAVPVPTGLVRDLAALADERSPGAPLFPWSRAHGWRIISRLMSKAGIHGPQATSRGLRHHFGVNAIGSRVPESLLQRWLGHARPQSTRIYTFVVGAEERALAKRMW